MKTLANMFVRWLFGFLLFGTVIGTCEVCAEHVIDSSKL